MAELFVDDSYNSNLAIEALDECGFTYEIHSECEAKKLGYKKLPILVIEDKSYDFKKIIRKAQRGEFK